MNNDLLMTQVDRPRDFGFKTLRRELIALAISLLLIVGCAPGGDSVADNGGMSGTGISQGAVSAFGSIFVNGVEWDLSAATIELDGRAAAESDLRLGMVVRVDGNFAAGGLTGTANTVRFDDSLEGPIQNTPVETITGIEKQFAILGQTVVVNATTTVFDGGASYAGLTIDDVLEVSGFFDASGAIRASRIESKGRFPANAQIEIRGQVANLSQQPDGSGVLDLGSIVVRYTASTTFSDVTRASLANGDRVEIEGLLRMSGTEVDATELELEVAGFGTANAEDVEIEGIVTSCPQSPDFCVSGAPIDASSAVFDPTTFVPMPGDLVEVEGALVSGVIEAVRIESEDADPDDRNVRIEAAVLSVDPVARTLSILGVTIEADGETRLEDKSAVGDESFRFSEIGAGDYLEVRAIETGASRARAISIEREDATAGVDDVRFEGPVTLLEPATPAISILDRVVPLDVGTLYFDALDQARTEEQFFRNPGDVMLGDVVRVTDSGAADLSTLAEADEVEIEGP